MHKISAQSFGQLFGPGKISSTKQGKIFWIYIINEQMHITDIGAVELCSCPYVSEGAFWVVVSRVNRALERWKCLYKFEKVYFLFIIKLRLKFTMLILKISKKSLIYSSYLLKFMKIWFYLKRSSTLIAINFFFLMTFNFFKILFGQNLSILLLCARW